MTTPPDEVKAQDPDEIDPPGMEQDEEHIPDIPDLRDAPYSFQFFQAVRLLQRVRRDRSRVGLFSDPADEAVRFGVNPDLAFPPGEVSDLTEEPDGPWRMTLNFMGLVGHRGVLPNHYSLLAKRRVQKRDRAFLDFIDLFHHRVLSLLYRAMERARFYVPAEREDPDALTTHLLDVLGLGEAPAREALGFDEYELVGYAGLLGSTSRSALALEQLIGDRFAVPVSVHQFVGRWYDVSGSSRSRVDHATNEYSQRLGTGALVGDQVWDPQGRARIEIGPLSRARYLDFLPGAPSYEELRSVTRYFADDQIEFELRLILETEDVPPVRLGADRTDEKALLGWQSWIRSGSEAPPNAETTLPL